MDDYETAEPPVHTGSGEPDADGTISANATGQPHIIGSTEQSAQPESQLVRYHAMCRAIDAAYEVDEAKHIRDQAIALEVYARQARNVEAERKACEIRLRAERRAGELRRAEEKSKGGRPPKTCDHDGHTFSAPTNEERRRQLGISEKQDRQWQQLAAVPKDDFEAALADKTMIPTTAVIIKASEEPKKPNPVSKEAMWL